MLEFLLLLAAFLCLVAAAAGVTARVALGWAGLALFVLVPLIHAWPG
jgi:hypothetical protein